MTQIFFNKSVDFKQTRPDQEEIEMESRQVELERFVESWFTNYVL